MENLYEILRNINEDVDYENCTDLIDSHHLDSLSIIALVADIEDEFDITIPAAEITGIAAVSEHLPIPDIS